MKLVWMIGTLAIGALQAQVDKTQVEMQIKQMDKLAFLTGQWDGKAVAEFIPGQPQEARQQEMVTRKLGGLILLVEGIGTIEREGKAIVIHEALATISYDLNGGFYRMRSHDKYGRYVDAEGKWVDGTFQWGFKTAQGEMKYTIYKKEDGTWHEIGEMSRDGSQWRKFLEMNLSRVK